MTKEYWHGSAMKFGIKFIALSNIIIGLALLLIETGYFFRAAHRSFAEYSTLLIGLATTYFFIKLGLDTFRSKPVLRTENIINSAICFFYFIFTAWVLYDEKNWILFALNLEVIGYVAWSLWYLKRL